MAVLLSAVSFLVEKSQPQRRCQQTQCL